MKLSPDEELFLRAARAGTIDPFGHREHVRLAFVAAKATDGSPAAITAVCEVAIRRIATRAGQPDRFHATITRGWATLVAHHVAETPHLSFDQLLEAAPELLDVTALMRFYSPERLLGAAARKAWVAPDLAPLPERRP